MADVLLALLVLKTTQIEKLLVFYETLGVALVEEQHGKGPVHYAGKLERTVFELYPASAADSVDVGVRLGFRVPGLAETITAVGSIGAPVVSEPKATEWGTRAIVRDPDGRMVELYQQ